ncbi:Protein of unknown function, partial [Gryllus bimaculatus]
MRGVDEAEPPKTASLARAAPRASSATVAPRSRCSL